MTSCSVHLDSEAARLRALERYQVLDTPREQAFDDIAELASEICGTPIAVVNLIGGGRQFFKAEVGLGVRETPLQTSFCRQAILQADFLYVPDATQDPRFAGNPLVTDEPRLRFYAGAVIAPSGSKDSGKVEQGGSAAAPGDTPEGTDASGGAAIQQEVHTGAAPFSETDSTPGCGIHDDHSTSVETTASLVREYLPLEFEADDLDSRNWVMDFGSLKPVRQWLEQTFDHRTLVAADDPLLTEIQVMEEIGLIQLVVLPHVSCEAFAEHIFAWVDDWLSDQRLSPRIRLAEVHVREHGANAAKVLA